MSVDALLPYLREHWPCLKEELLAGKYQPRPVRKVEIPKPGGGVRQLGIPTVLDRLIQQALRQNMQQNKDVILIKNFFPLAPKTETANRFFS